MKIAKWFNLFKAVERIEDLLGLILNKQTEIGDKIIMTSTENAARIEAGLAKISAATTGIRADIVELKGQIGTGMTQPDVDAAIAKLDTIGAQLAALDAENPAPTPAPVA